MGAGGLTYSVDNAVVYCFVGVEVSGALDIPLNYLLLLVHVLGHQGRLQSRRVHGSILALHTIILHSSTFFRRLPSAQKDEQASGGMPKQDLVKLLVCQTQVEKDDFGLLHTVTLPADREMFTGCTLIVQATPLHHQ
jgi:hypothetical protein